MEPQTLATQVHALLVDMDPARHARVPLPRLQDRLHQVASQATAAARATQDAALAANSRVGEAVTALVDRLDPSTELSTVSDVAQVRAQLAPLYASLAAALSDRGIRLGSVNGTNHKRTVFHVGSGLLVLLACHTVLDRNLALLLAGGATAFSWFLELTRKRSERLNQVLMGVFRLVARPHEKHRPNSSTWFATALFTVALTAWKTPALLGVLVLALADPTAAYVGRRWGRIPLMHGRTLEGSLAFVGMGTLAGMAYLMALGTSGPAVLLVPLVASSVGAVAEVTASRVDDNLLVPVFSSWAAWLMLAALT